MAEEEVENYLQSLQDLTFNSKPLINMLTMLAEENMQYAPQIVSGIEDHLRKGKINQKLPTLYLIDSIIKNIPDSDYLQLFTQNIVSTFAGVFEQVDEKTRASMFKLRQTWSTIFPNKKMYALDLRVQQLDPAWPITATPPETGGGSIHQKEEAEAAMAAKQREEEEEEQEALMRQQLIAKQQELINLKLAQTNLELAQTKAKLEVQQKELEMKKEQANVSPAPAPHVAPQIPSLAPSADSRDPRMSRDPRRGRISKQSVTAPVVTTNGTFSSVTPSMCSAFPLDNLLPPVTTGTGQPPVSNIPMPQKPPPLQDKPEVKQNKNVSPIKKDQKLKNDNDDVKHKPSQEQNKQSLKTEININKQIDKKPSKPTERLDVIRPGKGGIKRSSSERDKSPRSSTERESKISRSRESKKASDKDKKGSRSSSEKERSDDERYHKKQRDSKERRSRSRSPRRNRSTRSARGFRGRGGRPFRDPVRIPRGRRSGSRDRDTDHRSSRDREELKLTRDREETRPSKDETKFAHRGQRREARRSYRKKKKVPTATLR